MIMGLTQNYHEKVLLRALEIMMLQAISADAEMTWQVISAAEGAEIM
jgi:hypothetical protein